MSSMQIRWFNTDVLLPVIVLHAQLQIKLITGEVNIAEMEIASYGNGYVSRDNRYLGILVSRDCMATLIVIFQ